MSKIFISYRREDSADTCGRIYDRLRERFGKDAVFKDVDSIPLGVSFHDYIASVIRQCAVELVVIGPRWVSITSDDGRPRLAHADDNVRIEVEAGLTREIPVIPVLVQNASIPDRAQLPESLRELPGKNGLPVRRDPDFDTDMHRLIRQLEQWLGEVQPAQLAGLAVVASAPPLMPPSPSATIEERIARELDTAFAERD